MNRILQMITLCGIAGGGVLIESAGAIGVSGAPNGDADDRCAKAGIAAIKDDLEM